MSLHFSIPLIYIYIYILLCDKPQNSYFSLYNCWFPSNRKRLDATLQDLEEKQNSKKEAVSIFPLNF